MRFYVKYLMHKIIKLVKFILKLAKTSKKIRKVKRSKLSKLSIFLHNNVCITVFCFTECFTSNLVYREGTQGKRHSGKGIIITRNSG